MLGALDDFAWAGGAFVGGSLLSIAAFLLLHPFGIQGLAWALLVGSVASAAAIAVALVRRDWRPRLATVTGVRPAARALGILSVSSVSFMIAQVGFIVMIAVAARLDVGLVTTFTYSYMALGLIQAVFVSSVPMVLAAPIARTGTAIRGRCSLSTSWWPVSDASCSSP